MARWRAPQLDGRPVVVSGGDDHTVRVWDLATGTPVGSVLDAPGGLSSVVAVEVGGESLLGIAGQGLLCARPPVALGCSLPPA